MRGRFVAHGVAHDEAPAGPERGADSSQQRVLLIRAPVVQNIEEQNRVALRQRAGEDVALLEAQAAGTIR